MPPSKKRRVEMDADSIVSAFLDSSNQYVVSPNETNVMQLQRHLEVIDCLTSSSSDLGFFQSGSSLSSQCIAHVTNLLIDSKTKCTLIPRALSILQNLSKCSLMVQSLQSVFHVHSAISYYLHQHGSDFKDPLVLQCFDILENVTHGIEIGYLESHFENLIIVLLKLIDTESSQLLKMSLKVLSNIIRKNSSVQTYIWSLPHAKRFVKQFVALLTSDEPQIVVYALSILANLPSDSPNAAKLWTENHLMSTFQLIVKLLFSNEEDRANAAFDLFGDLMVVPNYETCFVKSNYMQSVLKRVSKILNESNSSKLVIFLKLLCVLVKIPSCQDKICSVLFQSVENCSSADIKIHPNIIRWCLSKKVSNNVSKLTLNLLKDIIVVYINNGNFPFIELSTKDAVKELLQNMDIPDMTSPSFSSDVKSHIIIFETVILLYKRTSLKQFIAEHSDVSILGEICKALIKEGKNDKCENKDCLSLFLMVLEVITLVGTDSLKLETLISTIFGYPKGIQYLTSAMNSNHSEYVNRALLIVSQIKHDPILNDLSKHIALKNSTLKVSESSASSYAGLEAMSRSQNLSNCNEKQVDSLISKIEKGLSIKDLKQSEIMELYEHKIALQTRKEQELHNYIDSKTAALQKADQIMTQYKCRQADSDAEATRLRIMVKEYESQCEQAVAKYKEALQRSNEQKEELDLAWSKVRDLQNYEKEQNELMQTQMNRQYEQKKVFEEEKARLMEALHGKECEKKTLTVQIQQMDEEMKLKNKAYESLKEAKEESVKKLEDFKKSMEKTQLSFEQKQSDFEKKLDSAQQTIASLEQKNESLAVESETRIENCNKQILELEGERDVMQEQLKMKESKISDLHENIRNLNLQLSEKCSELKEAESENKKFKSTLEENKSKISKLEKEVNMLELLCKKYESSLEKKQKEIKSLTDKLEDNREQCEKLVEESEKKVKEMEAELEKFKNITEMINQMTSGKIHRPKSGK